MSNIQFQRGAITPGDCIGNAWTLVTNKFWLYVGIGFLTILLIGCIPVVNLFVMGPVLGGFYFVVLRDMRGEPVDFGMMFKGFEKFVPLMVVGLIQAIPGIIFQIFRFTIDLSQFAGINRGGRSGSGDFLQSTPPNLSNLIQGLSIVFVFVMLAFALFTIVWNIILQFAVPIVLENEISPIDAIKLSISAAFGNIGGLIVLIILDILVGILGLIALCLGYFVAIPVIYAANAFAYRQVFPMIEQRFNMSPPPPTAYGSNFGSGM